MNFGSGNQLLGGDANQALNQAIAARQTGQAGVGAQVSPAAPTGVSPVQTLNTQPGMSAPGQGPMGTSLTGGGEEGMGMQPLTTVGERPASAFHPDEIKTILGALNGRLKAISRLQGDVKG